MNMYGNTMVACTIEEIPVYPKFAVFKKRSSLGDTPWVCEDDDGRIAYVSEDAKKAFINHVVASPYGRSRRGGRAKV